MTLAIVGAGLIGRSVALAARRANADVEIVEIDRGDSLQKATDADLIVLATPVDVILDIVRHHSDVLRTAVTIDTGSTKRLIVAAARDAGLDRFVGGHPMAGAASSGPKAARADMFDARPWFLVTEGAADVAAERARTFVASLGAQPVMMADAGAEHDRVMAAVSHLPQLVATTLISVAANAAGECLSWAGNGLRDTTRLADSSASMWESITATNASELRPLLVEMADRLRQLADDLADPAKVRLAFEEANRNRASLL